MSSINSIGAAGSGYLYESLSSGSRINRAADGAAELAISQEFTRQENGYDVGTRNMEDGVRAINIADGALSTITDSLQRIRELGVKASNGLLNDEDKQYIQAEVDQLKKSIADTADRANYNGIPLLDNEDGKVLLISSDANGNSRPMSMVNGTLDALGIEDFDVTGDFDLNAIDNALKTLNAGRSTLGAQSNGLEHAINNNNVASYNATASKSAMMDTDYAEYVGKLKTQNLLEEAQARLQKKRQEDHANKILGVIGN